MNIHTALTQADWRMRAYFGAPTTDPQRIGWRRDSCNCPIGEWLFFEDPPGGELFPYIGRDWIIWGNTRVVMPPTLQRFIDLLDREPPSIFRGEASCVSRDEAEAALLEAEHQAAMRLLPEYAESLARCDFRDERCTCLNQAASPQLYGFLDMNAAPHSSKPQRASCRLFFGRLCAAHLPRLIVAPDWWWPQEFSAELVEAIA